MEILKNQSAPVEQWAQKHTCSAGDAHYAYTEDMSNRKENAILRLQSIKKIGFENFETLCTMIPDKHLSKNIVDFLVFEIHAEAIKYSFLTADEKGSMIYGAPEAIYLQTAEESKRCHELLDLCRAALTYMVSIKAERSKKSYYSVFTVCMNLAFKIAGDACAVNKHVGDAISATYNIKLCAKE